MTEHEQSVQYINEYIARARAAQAEFEKMTQEQVDLAVKTIGKVVYENAEYLAKLAVEETLFTHKRALTAYRCPLAKTCRHVFCFTYTVWLNC